MLLIQCRFLHLESLLQFHHLVCKLREQKQVESQKTYFRGVEKAMKGNSDSVDAPFFTILIRLKEFKGERTCV